MKRLIINADDFGLSPGISRGILSGMREGILTSTTAMVNMPHFADAAELARDNPDIAVGVHLTLLWGQPVAGAEQVPTLVEADGTFPRSLVVLARRYLLKQLSMADVLNEFRSQIQAFLDAGLTPTHLDTHKQTHCLPGVFDAMLTAAAEFGIDRVRFPVERGWPLDAEAVAAGVPRPSFKAAGKRRIIRFFSGRSRGRLEATGIRTTDHFTGMDYMDFLDENVFAFLLRNLPDGDTEIMTHPGYMDEAMKVYSRIPPHREIELAGLKAPAIREQVDAAGIELISFRDL